MQETQKTQPSEAATAFGRLLRQWRQRRTLTLGQVARRAGISVSTLSRWEWGRVLPKLPELEATLSALGANTAERQAALDSVQAPRTLRRQHDEETVTTAPNGGDLLRALRTRVGWTQSQTAQAIRTTQGQIAKWERADAWPDAERLQALCQVLGARPEEYAALMSGRFRLSGSSECDEEDGQEAWETRVMRSLYEAPDALLDLAFLQLEAGLWRQRQKSFALPLLALAYENHARAHLFYLHPLQAGIWAERSLELVRAYGNANPSQGAAVIAAGAAFAAPGRPSDLRRAARLIEDWLPRLTHQGCRAWATSEVARYRAQLGESEAALEISQRAVHIAGEYVGVDEWLYRLRDHAVLLADLKRHEEALKVLGQARKLTDASSDAYLRHYLLEAECLRAVGALSESAQALQQAEARYHTAIKQENLQYLTPMLDAQIARHPLRKPR